MGVGGRINQGFVRGRVPTFPVVWGERKDCSRDTIDGSEAVFRRPNQVKHFQRLFLEKVDLRKQCKRVS